MITKLATLIFCKKCEKGFIHKFWTTEGEILTLFAKQNEIPLFTFTEIIFTEGRKIEFLNKFEITHTSPLANNPSLFLQASYFSILLSLFTEIDKKAVNLHRFKKQISSVNYY